jgi:hypothetical protein
MNNFNNVFEGSKGSSTSIILSTKSGSDEPMDFEEWSK